MAIREILVFPDPRLRKQAKIVQHVDKTVQTLVDDMFETMYSGHGVGLAATQINVQQRVFVLDTSDDYQQPICFINPEIVEVYHEGAAEEGCFSLPGLYERVKRPDDLRVKALDQQGKPFELHAKDLQARCIHHEIEHLDGKLFIDHLSPLKRRMASKKLKKYHHRTL